MQPVRIVQLDRASGTATASLHAMLKGFLRRSTAAPRSARPLAGGGDASARPAPPPRTPPPARKPSASERARRQQEAILRRCAAGPEAPR